MDSSGWYDLGGRGSLAAEGSAPADLGGAEGFGRGGGPATHAAGDGGGGSQVDHTGWYDLSGMCPGSAAEVAVAAAGTDADTARHAAATGSGCAARSHEHAGGTAASAGRPGDVGLCASPGRLDGVGVHRVGAALAEVARVLGEVADVPLFSVGPEQAGELLVAAEAAAARLAGLRLRLVAHADAAGTADRAGAPSTAAWLRARCRSDPRGAPGFVRLARALESRYPATAAALAAGQITAEQARVVVVACDALPAGAGPAVRADAEAYLLTQAAAFDPVELARLGRRVLEVVAPEEADRLIADQLAREEARANRRELCRAPDGTGGLFLRGRLDPEGAALVEAALDPLAAPRPGTENGPDPRSGAQRYADALVELARRALTGAPDAGAPLPATGGEATTMILTMDLDRLREQLGFALLPSGDMVSAATARRRACDARIIPAVLGGSSQPLDLGRARRLFTPAQRRALALRDGGCCFPDCDRPVAWCQAHHIRHWVDGGPTDLGNGLLVCDHHHDVIHSGKWTVRIAADGRPEFIPPPWLDPRRRPRRNTRTHHRPRAA